MKQNQLILAALLVGGSLVFFVSSVSKSPSSSTPKEVVKRDTGSSVPQIVDGKQIIEVTARGGYNPRDIVAKAGVPTILRMKTSGTFDCSAAFLIPSLGIQKMLPQTGVTDFEIPVQKAGANITGTCGMGMYRLNINFQ